MASIQVVSVADVPWQSAGTRKAHPIISSWTWIISVPRTRPSGPLQSGTMAMEWLAFSWENFRLSAQRTNRLSTNEDTGEVEGKSTWFPLLDGSPKASWNDRCDKQEKPILLDPPVRMMFADRGFARRPHGGSRFCLGSNKEASGCPSRILGLNLPLLRGGSLARYARGSAARGHPTRFR